MQVDFGFSLPELCVLTYLLIVDFILGTTDTSSVTLAWSFAILCQYPDVQQRLIQELDAFTSANGRIPCFKERNEIPYTIAVMRGCMQFGSMTPLGVPHSVNQDGKYGCMIELTTHVDKVQ